MKNRNLKTQQERDFIQSIYRDYYTHMAWEIKKVLPKADKEKIKELIQDTIIRLIHYIETLQRLEPPQISLYARKTAKCVALLYARKRKLFQKWIYYPQEEVFQQMPDKAATPEEAYIEKETQQEIKDILDSLPEFYSDFLLFRMMGMGKRESCKALGIRLRDYDKWYQEACRIVYEEYIRRTKNG